jgi:hypothetical protein
VLRSISCWPSSTEQQYYELSKAFCGAGHARHHEPHAQCHREPAVGTLAAGHVLRRHAGWSEPLFRGAAHVLYFSYSGSTSWGRVRGPGQTAPGHVLHAASCSTTTLTACCACLKFDVLPVDRGSSSYLNQTEHRPPALHPQQLAAILLRRGRKSTDAGPHEQSFSVRRGARITCGIKIGFMAFYIKCLNLNGQPRRRRKLTGENP